MKTKDLVLVALFAALTAVLSMMPPIPVVGIPVPITLQTLGVMLSGAVLGPRLGLLAVGLYMVLWMIGLPVLPGGRAGIGVLAAPSAGFLVGMLLGAWITGLLVWQLGQRARAGGMRLMAYGVSTFVGGVVAVYLVGVPWLAVVTGIGMEKALLGSLAFLPGDLLKAGVAAIVAVQVHRSLPLPARA